MRTLYRVRATRFNGKDIWLQNYWTRHEAEAFLERIKANYEKIWVVEEEVDY